MTPPDGSTVSSTGPVSALTEVPTVVDHIIVGAGVAGCVLAARLSENPELSVLLIESGDDPAQGPPELQNAIATPGLAPTLWADHRVANLDITVPQAALENRRVPLTTGRGLGGGSTINAMAWSHGFPADYDSWASHGAVGWGWDVIGPLLRGAENHELGPSEHHGGSGPVSVSTPRHLHPASAAFVQSGVRAGIELSHDLNGEHREGIGHLPVTMRDGARHSAVDAYLRPALSRPNLHVLTQEQVRRVVIEGGRAVGVLTGEGHEWRARRDVVLCAGTLRTPQLLMLSGIGPADHLTAHGIEVLHHSPSVGMNLHDHPVVSIAWALVDTVAARGGRYDDASEVYRLLHRGPLAAIGQTVAVTRSSARVDQPDLHLIFAPLGEDAGGPPLPVPMVACHLALLAPHSRGSVRLASADPTDSPLIDPAYLTEPADRARLHDGLRRMQEVFDEAPLSSLTGQRLGLDRDADTSSIDAYINENLATYWHPVGTARMGDDEDAVVDPTLAVRGVRDLIVADASVMPHIPAAALQAPTTAIAERAAQILARSLQ